MWGKEFSYIARVNSATQKSGTKFTYTESPLLTKQTSSKPGGYNQIEQILVCENILNALNNQDERQAEKYIKKLSAIVLKEKFSLLNKEYHDIKYRKNNLVFKIDSLNNLLNRLGSLQVIDPQDIKLKDDIRQLDINALKKVVKLTNECKVIQLIFKHKADKMKTIQFIKFVPDQSITLINNLKSYQTLQNKYKKKKKQIQEICSKNKQLSQQLQKIQDNEQILKVFQQNNLMLDEKLKKQKQLRQKDKKQRSISQKIEFLTTNNTQRSYKQYNVSFQIIELQNQLKIHKEQLTTLKNKIDCLNKQLENLRHKKDTQIDKIVLQKKKVEKQLSTLKGQAAKMEKDMKIKLTDLQNKYKEQCKRTIMTFDMLESQIMQFNSEIEKQKSEKQLLQLQLKADKEAYDERQKNLNQLLEHAQKQSQQYYNALSQKEVKQNILQSRLYTAQEELKLLQENFQEKQKVQKVLFKQINKYYEKESQQKERQMSRMEQDKRYKQEIKDQNGLFEIQLSQLKLSNQKYEQIIQKTNFELNLCRKDIENIVSRQNQDMKNAQLSIHRLTQELQLEKKKTKQLEQLFDKLTEANQALENELKMKQKQRQALAFKINQGGDTSQKQRMQKKIKKYEGQIEDLTHQVDLLNQTLQEITKFSQSMDAKDIDEQAKKAETQEFIEKLRQSRYREVSQKDETNAKLSEQLSRITQQLKQKSQALMEMQQKMKSTIAQQEKLKAKVEQLTLQSSYKDSQIKILSQQKQLLMKQNSQYQLLNRQQVQKCENRIRMLENQLILRKEGDRTLDSLFQNDLLQYHRQHKSYLKEAIEQRINTKIQKSRLLYRYDPLSKVNVHNYIDKKENLVLIVKMANGAFLAAFTQDSFEPKKVSKGDGLIISLTSREVFTLIQPNKRAITYDDYHIIFGNLQIKLKSQENKLFSNFGINNSYYASRGFKASVLLGGSNDERELQLESYELYQLEISRKE